jgi:hypothetical protein
MARKGKIDVERESEREGSETYENNYMHQHHFTRMQVHARTHANIRSMPVTIMSFISRSPSHQPLYSTYSGYKTPDGRTDLGLLLRAASESGWGLTTVRTWGGVAEDGIA